MEEHRGSIPMNAAQLEQMALRFTEPEPQTRKKVINHRRNDDEKTGRCVAIANYYVASSQAEQQQRNSDAEGVFAQASLLAEEAPTNPAGIEGGVFKVFSNAQSMGQFAESWKRKQQSAIEKRHQTVVLDEAVQEKETVFSVASTRREMDLGMLSGFDELEKLKSLFDQGTRHYESTINKDQPLPIKMPVDSSHHIRRLLVLYDEERPFAACINSKFGGCQAQKILKHPGGDGEPLIAYYSEPDYMKVCLGGPLPPNYTSGGSDLEQMTYQNICEFCNRALVAARVEEAKYNNNEIDQEIPSRYYQVGPGEYSQDGMHQQVVSKKATFTNGIIGNMRDWNTGDFIPAAMTFSEDHQHLCEMLHWDEYEARRARGTLSTGRRWIRGWIETGPFYAENEATLRPVKEINPYTYTFVTTARSPSVGHMLEDYFDRMSRRVRLSEEWEVSHLFWDIIRCWEDPGYLDRRAYRPKNGLWKGFCVHRVDEAPDPATHKLYYIVLHKVNTLRRLIKAKNPLGLTPYLMQKIQVYLSSYHSLRNYIGQAKDYSDDALLARIYPEPRLGVVTNALAFFYPLPIYHHRNGDLAYHRLAAHRYTRNNPLINCVQFYEERAAERREKPDTCLHELPHAFEMVDNYEAVIQQLGAAASLDGYEAVVQEMKAMFTQNTLAIKVFGVNFRWKECTVKKQRKQALKRDLEDPSIGEKKRQKQWKAVIRTLGTVNQSIYNNFKQMQDWVDERTARYLHLLDHYGPHVFCSFSTSLAWVRETDTAALLADFDSFKSVVSPTNLVALGVLLEGSKTSPWSSYGILLTLLFRVAVLEELHKLEPYDREKVRHNLVLLRNSHLRLYRKIFSNPRAPMTDLQLERPLDFGTKLSSFEFYYPHPERELHGGNLPNYTDRLECVPFFSTSNMDPFPWNRLQEKMPDRCCRVRDFARMLEGLCSDITLYRWTVLVLRLSLCGLYEHCKVSPSFARTLILDELFDENNANTLKSSILDFIVANHDVVLNSMSESLCYQLNMKPSLLAMLKKVYHDWFAWRIEANGDMTRDLFSIEGHFQSVLQVIIQRMKLKSMRTVFRLSESNFVIWLCSAFKYADDNRHKSQMPCLPDEAAIDPTIDAVIQNLVLKLDPRKKLDARVLGLFGIEDKQIFTLADLNKVFLVQIMQASDQEIPPELRRFNLTSKKLVERIHSIPPQQYVVLCHFFTLLKNYQAVRAIPIRNAAILEKQWTRIQERAAVSEFKEIERSAFCVAFSLCCRHVKNSWSSKPGTPSIGFEDIFYDVDNEIYVCAKKPHQALEGEDGASTTSKRKIDRELRRPVCARTEPFAVFLPGLLVEADGYKIPGTKRASLNETAAAASSSKKAVFTLPLPGYWLNPCCGIPFEYDFLRNTPAGYYCRFCPNGIQMFDSFLELNCQVCHARITDNRYYLHRVFDDVFEMRPCRLVFCPDCHAGVRIMVERFRLLSVLLRMLNSKDSVATLIQD